MPSVADKPAALTHGGSTSTSAAGATGSRATRKAQRAAEALERAGEPQSKRRIRTTTSRAYRPGRLPTAIGKNTDGSSPARIGTGIPEPMGRRARRWDPAICVVRPRPSAVVASGACTGQDLHRKASPPRREIRCEFDHQPSAAVPAAGSGIGPRTCGDGGSRVLPWRRLDSPNPQSSPTARSRAQCVRQMLRAIKPRSRPIVMAARISGLRRGALMRLETKDIDWTRAIIRAISKGRAGGKLTPVPITRLWRWVLGAMARSRSAGCSVSRRKPCGRTGRKRDGRIEQAGPPVGRKLSRHSFAQALGDAGAGNVHHGCAPSFRPKLATAIREGSDKACTPADRKYGQPTRAPEPHKRGPSRT